MLIFIDRPVILAMEITIKLLAIVLLELNGAFCNYGRKTH